MLRSFFDACFDCFLIPNLSMGSRFHKFSSCISIEKFLLSFSTETIDCTNSLQSAELELA